MRCACSTSPPKVPFSVPWSVIRRFARRRRWASGLNGHSLKTTRAQLAGPRHDPWSVTPRFALRRPWPSSLRMRRGTNVAQTPSKTSRMATNHLRYPPAASRPTFRPPFPRRSPCALHFVDPGRRACECHAAQTRANTFAEIATNRPRLPQRSAAPFPRRSPSALHFVDPGRRACECQAVQTRANTFADIATNRLHDAPAASPQPSRPPFPRRSPGALHLVDPGSGPADPKGRKLNAHPGGPVTRARPATHWQCQQNAPRSSPSHPRQSALSAWPEQCCIFVNTDGPRAKSHSGGASMKAVQRVDRMKPRSR